MAFCRNLQKDLTRHANISTTMNVYGGAMPEPMREAQQRRCQDGNPVMDGGSTVLMPKLLKIWRRDRDSNCE